MKQPPGMDGWIDRNAIFIRVYLYFYFACIFSLLVLVILEQKLIYIS